MIKDYPPFFCQIAIVFVTLSKFRTRAQIDIPYYNQIE